MTSAKGTMGDALAHPDLPGDLPHREFAVEGVEKAMRLSAAIVGLRQGVEAGMIPNAVLEGHKFTLSSAYYKEESNLRSPSYDALERDGMSRWSDAAKLLSSMTPYSLVHVGTIPKKVAAARKAGLSPIAEAYVATVERFCERWTPARDILAQAKAVAVKGRRNLDPSELKTLPRTVDGTGTCGCCERNVKLDDRDRMVDHGFQVVANERSGKCPGVGLGPVEITPAGIDEMIRLAIGRRKPIEARLSLHGRQDPQVVAERPQRGKPAVWIGPDDQAYPRFKAREMSELRTLLDMEDRTIERQTKRRAAWTQGPLPDGRRDHLEAAPPTVEPNATEDHEEGFASPSP